MVKAVIKNGLIVPLVPLPPEWGEGRNVVVEDAESTDEDSNDAERLGRGATDWVRDVRDAAEKVSPGDADTMLAAIDDFRREQKELMRREMGLL